MRESHQHVRTDDGDMPVEVFVPELGDCYPGIIFFMDIFGFRDELRRMCRRYATAGYAVFLPGLFYRHGNPGFAPANRKGDPVSAEARRLNAATTQAMTAADMRFLIGMADGLAGVRVPVFGTVGYCMGGRHAVACAVENPGQVRAAASLHGGQLLNDGPYSMDRMIDQVQGELYFGFARDDPTCPAEDQARIAEALAQSATPGRIEHYDAEHGWTFPERHCFDEAAADRTWENMFHLFRTRLWQAPAGQGG